MATYGDQMKITGLTAAASLAAAQFKAVKLASTAGQVKVCSSTTDVTIGILQNDPAAGEPADIAFLGESKAVMAASVTAGNWLIPNSTGQLKATSTAGKTIVGIALETHTTAGEIHKVLLAGLNRY
jgi:hypothetical protein